MNIVDPNADHTVPYIPFPTALHTVDIIAFSIINGKFAICLGKKPKVKNWQIPGGFVDPTDTSAESAALRELSEETLMEIKRDLGFNIPLLQGQLMAMEIRRAQSEMYYLGSFNNNLDERYIDSPHKIITSLFVTCVTEEEALTSKAGDDLERIGWFDAKEISELNEEGFNTLIRDVHRPLVRRFLSLFFPSPLKLT